MGTNKMEIFEEKLKDKVAAYKLVRGDVYKDSYGVAKIVLERVKRTVNSWWQVDIKYVLYDEALSAFKSGKSLLLADEQAPRYDFYTYEDTGELCYFAESKLSIIPVWRKVDGVKTICFVMEGTVSRT